jgi:membrane protease YdiL (CAAX protease family)
MAFSSTTGIPAIRQAHVPAFGPLTSPKIRTLGIVGLLFLAQIFVWLSTVVNVNTSGDSALLPSSGNWSPWGLDMEFYLITMLGTMILVGYTDVSVVPKTKDISRFLISYSIWTFVAWGVLTLIYPHGTGVTALTGTLRFQQLVFTSLFVAPTEELLFRVVLPKVLNSWILGSVVAFTLFHLSAYSIEYPAEIISALISVIALGFILWFIYDFQLKYKTKHGTDLLVVGGFGGSTGFHSGYDLVVQGVLGPLLRGFGLVAI